MRDPSTMHFRTTTIALPVQEANQTGAAIGIGFFKSAMPINAVAERVIASLRDITNRIEKSPVIVNSGPPITELV